MKSSLMRPALALALVLGLSACGGKASFTVGVTVTGLEFPGLELSTNNMVLPVSPSSPPGAVVTANFPKSIEYGDVYEVKVTKNPEHQTCGIPPGDRSFTDTAGRLTTINAHIQCFLVSNALGGTVAGLNADGLVLANGSSTVTVPKGATSFAFPVAVNFGVTYGITVLSQPEGQVCSVATGAGTMADQAPTNIAITCT